MLNVKQYNSSHTQLRDTGCNLPYRITQCYLPPNTRLILNLSTQEGWKAELTYGDWLHTEMVYVPTGSNPSK